MSHVLSQFFLFIFTTISDSISEFIFSFYRILIPSIYKFSIIESSHSDIIAFGIFWTYFYLIHYLKTPSHFIDISVIILLREIPRHTNRFTTSSRAVFQKKPNLLVRKWNIIWEKLRDGGEKGRKVKRSRRNIFVYIYMPSKGDTCNRQYARYWLTNAGNIPASHITRNYDLHTHTQLQAAFLSSTLTKTTIQP